MSKFFLNKKNVTLLIFLFIVLLFSTSIKTNEESKPLLRIFPIYRIEECEWAIRFDICIKCIRKKEQYAQRIRFFSESVYREHGCFSDTNGFYVLGVEEK